MDGLVWERNKDSQISVPFVCMKLERISVECDQRNVVVDFSCRSDYSGSSYYKCFVASWKLNRCIFIRQIS